MKKEQLLYHIVARLSESLSLLERAAQTSHLEATHESSKAESKYDTRGLEAAYLAGGQARKAREIQEAIELYQKLSAKKFGPSDMIDLTALVQLEVDGTRSFYF